MKQNTNNRQSKNKGRKNEDSFQELTPRFFDDVKTKAVWANYLNMARQNTYQTLCHITHVLGLAYNPEDKELEANLLQIPAVTLLLKKGNAEKKQKAMKLLDKHFPFMTPMLEQYVKLQQEKSTRGKETTPEDYYAILNMILPLINLLRNKYTHYKIEDPKLDAFGKIADPGILKNCHTLARLLNFCFDGARRIVKERFGTGENAPLKDEDFDFLTEEGKRYYKEDKKFIERKDFKYRIFHDTQKISNIGIFMLTCLLLEKKYASEFADQTDFFGKNLEPKRRPTENEILIMREAISVYRIRLPKDRMQSDRGESALGLDMLNELKKCPRELFDTLSPADQETFRVEANDNEDGKVLLLRSHDRFPTLSLQYIDYKQLFAHIRFQVQLGNYRYKFYEKEWIDKSKEQTDKDGADERIRILQKELTGYGRLQEIESQRNERWGHIIRKIDAPRQDTLDTQPYVTDHHASYLFNNNRIGLLWNTEKEHPLRNGVFMPSLELPSWLDDYPAKAAELRGTTQKTDEKVAECRAPMCWLSTYELPAVIFLSLLTGSGQTAEELIKNTTAAYRRLFADIASGKLLPGGDLTPYGIELKLLPEKIQDYLTGKEVDMNSRFAALARQKVERMLRATESRLKHFQADLAAYASKDNKVGKKSHVDLRPGTLARHLADDMMFFKEADKNNQVKLTGQNFNILQAELAQYPKKTEGKLALDNLRTLLRNADLIDGERPHPFLNEVLSQNPTSFYALYQAYLECKKQYVEKLLTEPDAALCNLHFLYPNRKKWAPRDDAFYRELAMRYTTIELPRGLFHKAIIETLRRSDVADRLPLLKDGNPERFNVAYLIAAYFKATGDASQVFYGNKFKRYYKYQSMTISPQWDYSAPVAQLVKKYYSVADMENYHRQTDTGETPGTRYEKREQKYKESLETRAAALIQKAEKKLEKKKLKGTYNPGKDEPQLKKRKRAILQERDNEIAIVPDKLRKYRNEYADNDKAIRRYQVQDMLLFLMAKDILTQSMAEHINLKAYKLCHIGQGDKDILSLQLPFSIVLEVKTGREDEPVRYITITQQDLKLKNYGDFFRFIYDSRIRSLLQQTRLTEIDRTSLEEELMHYNQHRIPVFELIHDIEKRIWQLLPDGAALHAQEDGVQIDFKYLMRFIDIKESSKRLVCAIRNAFSHSNYPTEAVVARIIFDKADIPQVADRLAVELRNKTSQIRLKKTE